VIGVAEARARVLAGLSPCGAEIVGLADAWGRVLASPVAARLTQPPADVSAMDGYAVRAADTAPPRALAIVGEAPAGHPASVTVSEGQALRLYTGSVMPSGADTVLLQEDAAAAQGWVTPAAAQRAGQHIRPQGQDFAAGDLLIAPGRRLGARDIGLAAAANHPFLAVHRRPRVAILATGDEIAMPGEPIGPGGIVSSNSHMLAALVRAGGGEPVLLPVARDDSGAIAAAAASAAGVDMLVTTGGASVGDHDLVQQGLARHGFALDFWKIAMRPGKPMMFGRLGETPVLGLPGNPVSAFVCAVLFLMPALARMAGLAEAGPAVDSAVLGAAVRANDHRADHLRASLSRDSEGRLVVFPFPRQDSALLRVLAGAGALVLRPPFAPALEPGAAVSVIRLDGLGL
jgi:molybdopterin molybdotransferase